MAHIPILLVAFAALVHGNNVPMSYDLLLKAYEVHGVDSHGLEPRIVEHHPRVVEPRLFEPLRLQHRHREKEHDDRHARSQVPMPPRGLVPPVLTPRHHDGSLNLAVIPEYAEFLHHNGIKAVEVIGTDGEGPALNLEQKKHIIDAWVREGKRLGIEVIVQVGAVPYPDVIATTRYAQAAGADAIITLPEVYYKPSTLEQLVDFIDEVGKAAPHLPILYYHYPNMTGVVFPAPEIVKYLTAHVPNYRGIKYDTNDLSQLTDVVLLSKHNHQEVYLAADRLTAPGALLGVRSILSGSVNFFPGLVREILDAVEHSDLKRPRLLQEKLTLGYEAILDAGNTVSALKAAMEIVTGIKVGPAGRPIPPITDSARHRLESRLKELGLIHREH